MNADGYGEIGTWAPARIPEIWRARPESAIFPVAGILAGTAAIVLGVVASKAFTNIGGGITIRAMGILMLVGGMLALAGIARADRLVEMIGHSMVTAGTVIYPFGVILGLGLGGILAGIGYTAIAVTLGSRIWLMTRPSR